MRPDLWINKMRYIFSGFCYLLVTLLSCHMGIIHKDDFLNGQLRVSLFDSTNYKDIPQHVDFSEESDDAYNTNIQIAELNALNATMAVIKWKQYFKVYMDNNRKQQDRVCR